MWHQNPRRPTFQIDGGIMNIFLPNPQGPGAGGAVGSSSLSMLPEDARPTPTNGATSRTVAGSLHVGFAACFPAKEEHQYTEHWVLFPSFRSPRVTIEGGVKRSVDPLILEAAEPDEVLPGGWESEDEFLAQVRAFIATRRDVRYIRHQRTDSLGFVP